MDTVGIVLNGLLVLVTTVYVVLTFRLASSSARAAVSAAESAAAAADSARSQRAAIEAEAYRRHAWFKTGGGGASYEQWMIGVSPLVGAYVLRKVVLRDISFMPDAPDASGARQAMQVEVNQELTPEPGYQLPRLVDEVEGGRFVVDVAALARQVMLDDDWSIVNWSCEVTYSLSESTETSRRLIVYLDPKMDPRLHWLKQAGELGLG